MHPSCLYFAIRSFIIVMVCGYLSGGRGFLCYAASHFELVAAIQCRFARFQRCCMEREFSLQFYCNFAVFWLAICTDEFSLAVCTDVAVQSSVCDRSVFDNLR